MLLASTLHSIRVNSVGQDYQIVVFSPFEISGERILWVHEREPRGNVAAHAGGLAASRGEIIVSMTDDTIALPGWLHAIDRQMRRERDFLVCLDLNRVNRPFVHTVFGRFYALFPVASRACAEKLGGMFDPIYMAHYANPDFSLRVWQASAADLKFLQRLQQNRLGTSNRKAALES